MLDFLGYEGRYFDTVDGYLLYKGNDWEKNSSTFYYKIYILGAKGEKLFYSNIKEPTTIKFVTNGIMIVINHDSGQEKAISQIPYTSLQKIEYSKGILNIRLK